MAQKIKKAIMTADKNLRPRGARHDVRNIYYNAPVKYGYVNQHLIHSVLSDFSGKISVWNNLTNCRAN